MADTGAPRTPGTGGDFPSLVEESLTQDKFHAATSVLSKTNNVFGSLSLRTQNLPKARHHGRSSASSRPAARPT